MSPPRTTLGASSASRACGTVAERVIVCCPSSPLTPRTTGTASRTSSARRAHGYPRRPSRSRIRAKSRPAAVTAAPAGCSCPDAPLDLFDVGLHVLDRLLGRGRRRLGDLALAGERG